jgi:hypothetical protein
LSSKLPSFKRLVLFAFLLLTLLASVVYLVVYLRPGYEIEVPSELDFAISSVWEDCSRLASSGREESDQNSPYSVLGPASFTSTSSSPPTSPTLNFSSSVSPSLFRTWGTLTLHGGSTLSYLILNATLWDGDRLVESTRYMMMEVVPGERRDFDICERCHLSLDRGYSCLLGVEEPEKLFVSERRDCLVVEDDPRAVVWEDIGSTRGGEVGSAGSTKEASTSSSSRSTERDREVVAPSGDLESEEEDQRSGSSSGDDLEAEEEVTTEEEVETDYEDEAVGGYYVGSTTSNKYHRPDCSYAKKIKEENRVYFSDAWEAREAGYLPCKVCNPE